MLNINELLIATKGKLINGDKNYIPRNYVIDSRILNKEDFFIPIIGEKVDGHNYIIDSVKNGISGYFICYNLENKTEIIEESIKINSNIIIIEVKDTKRALIDSAKFNRVKHIDIPIVAITGSVGKTSTREIIASVLSQEKNVLVTEKNYNSNIGISIMCLKIENQDVCVLEAGIDKFDEMEELSEILKPDIVCFTVIGSSHIGTFKTRDNIFSEKFKLTKYIKGINKIIINSDDDKLQKIDRKKYNVIEISQNDISDIGIDDIKINYKTKIYNEIKVLTLEQIGIHNAKNSLFAIKVGEIFNIKKENIIKGIENYKNFKNRLNYSIINGIKIIDDTYNSSFESIKSGIETINNIKSTRKIIVIGDVFDLGEESEKIHKKIGEYLTKKDIDIILLSGNSMKYTYDIVKNRITSKYFNDKDDILKYLLENSKQGDLIYFKASNGMKYTELVNKFKENLVK